MDEPQSIVTIRGKGEFYAQEERSEITLRLLDKDSQFVYFNAIVNMDYRGMTVAKTEIVSVEEV